MGGQQNQKAIVALVLGIVGFFVCPLVGIASIIVGGQARSEIRASGGVQTGEGMATAGVVLGWIQIGLTAVAIIIFVLIAVIGAIASLSTTPH